MVTRIQAPASRPRHTQMQNTQPTTPPTVKDLPPDDDLVPSLPPDWQPPTFLTQDMPFPQETCLNEEVSLM